MNHVRMLVFGILTVAVVLAGAAAASVSEARASAQSPGLGFIQVNSCYRIAFSIEGAPNYKILEVLDGGWMRGEVDAGTAKADRPSIWINSAQIVTMRQVRCSD